MSVQAGMLEDVRALSVQLNRQAFATPPVDGWLNSFLTMLHERFGAVGVQGVQVAQLNNNIAIPLATAGAIPHRAAHYTLDESSPLATALRTRTMFVAPDSRIYPILVGDVAPAALIVYASQADPDFDQAMTALSCQLGPALTHALMNVNSTTAPSVDMIRAISQVTQALGSALQSSEVLSQGAKSLVDLLQVDHAGIAIFDYVAGVATVVAEYPDRKTIGVKLPVSGTPTADYIIRERKPMMIMDVAASEELGSVRDDLLKYGIRGILLLPMLVENQLIGSIGLDLYQVRKPFSPEEVETALAISSQLASSIRNAQLYEEIKHRAAQLERIAHLSGRITGTFDRDEIFQIVREEAQLLIDTDLVAIALTQPDATALQLYTLQEPDVVVTEYPLSTTALRFVLTSQGPVVLDDISTSEFPDYKQLAQLGMHAIIAVPMSAGGRVIGTLSALHATSSKYSSLDVLVVQQIANQLAIALENARLYNLTASRAELQQLMGQLTSATQGGGNLQGILQNSLQQIGKAINARRGRVLLQALSAIPEDERHSTGRFKKGLMEKTEKSEK